MTAVAAPPPNVRVASVQFQLRGVRDRDEFCAKVAHLVGIAAGYAADFVVFPELFTLELLSADAERLPALAAIDRIADETDWFKEIMSGLAVSHRINIVGGSHPSRTASGSLRNVAYVFRRDGTIAAQDKLQITPSEKSVWHIEGGDDCRVIDTDCGPIGVLVCYDSEFPELVRHLADQGALILFVPFCTDDRRGYLRVRYCCQARAVENQIYVAMSGVCGILPNVENMEMNYAESAILTPSDMPFARDGIAADAPPNIETVVVADLSLAELARARREGAVRNFHDRRLDLYRVVWKPSSP